MKKFRFLTIMLFAGLMAFSFSSCEEEEPTPEPTVRFLVAVNAADGYTVDITLESTDATSFAWDYGDDNTSAEAASHSYTYAAAGDYTITVTATGDGGTATDTKDVTIAASIEEIIAGADNSGKVWVLTQNEADFSGKMGGGPVQDDGYLIPDMSLVPSNMMGLFGLGEEYTDEFTFFQDGTFKVDVKNNQAIAGIMYGNMTQSIQVPSNDPGSLPLCAVSYANVDDGTWALSYDDFTVTAYNEFTTAAIEDVDYTFGAESNVANLVLSSGAYVGLVDLAYPAIPDLGIAEPIDNSFYVIKEITPEAMHVIIGVNGVPFLDADGNPTYDLAPGVTPIFMYPTLTLHLTLVPKDM